MAGRIKGRFAVVFGCWGGTTTPAGDCCLTVGVAELGANRSLVEFGLALRTVAFGFDGGGSVGPSAVYVTDGFCTSTEASFSLAFVELIHTASEQHAPIAASCAILFKR